MSGNLQPSPVNPSVVTAGSRTPFLVDQDERKVALACLYHVALLVILATWAFGGMADWARTLVSVWASLALPLLIWSVRTSIRIRSSAPRQLHLLWPLIAFNLVVLVSLAFPGFRTGYYGDELLYIRNLVSPWLPSSARPAITLGALWLFNGVYLSAFNLLLSARSRHTLRALLFIIVFNALALAVFGTFQKLTHADGLYFGLQPSPQPRFFASFIYHNHWGAFCVLMIAAGFGLFFHHVHRHTIRELARTPAIFALLTVLAIALTIPMSGSRSCTIIALLLLGGAALHWMGIMRRRHRTFGGRSSSALLGLAVLIGLIAVSYPLAKPAIQERLRDTRHQVEQTRHSDSLNSRLVLYRDTWHMARDRLLFGWGLASFPNVFTIYNTQNRGTADNLPHYYHDAHNDWLQTLAELGIVGAVLLALCAVLPFWRFRHVVGRSFISLYLLCGCAVLLLYAWVEFPFGNVAVGICYWCSFFLALGYGRLESDH
ncbi:MAG: O-antigen ligase family protein [Opitutaceae bacterium]|nr:O-antigen ligase family protein [Opitutaceae bacterium]